MNEWMNLPQDTIDNASAATAHAPYHVTYAQGANCSHIFDIPDPDLPIHCTTFMALRLKQMELSAKTVYGPMLKITPRSAHAQNHVSVELCRKSFTTIVLGDHDFPLTASNFGNLTAFRAINFSHVFTAHAQKRLFMNFRLKFWYRFLDPDFFIGTIFPPFEDVFCWFLHWISWVSAIFILPF